jgi:hypothetical protein
LDSTDGTRRADGTPYVTVTARCEAGRHAACRGIVVSLLADPGTRCSCHRQPLPAAWAYQVAAYPPCELDGGDAA